MKTLQEIQKSFNNYLDLLTNKEHNKMSEKTTKEMKDLIKSIISELPEKLDEDFLIKSYEKAKTLLPSGEAVQLIKSIVDKKYPKAKAVPNKSELFKASESNYHIDIENLKEMTNEVLDFNQWDEDLTQEQQILKSNIEKIKPFETE